jgi:putative ABC transport system permease protein
MSMVPIIYTVNSLRLRFRSTAAAVLGIALAVFVMCTVLMLRQGVEKTVVSASSPGAAIVLRSGASAEMFSFINQQQIESLLEVARLRAGAIVPEFVIIKMFGSSDGRSAGTALVRGVPAAVYAPDWGFHLIAGRLPKPGQGEVLVGELASKRFAHMTLGSELQLAPSQAVRVVGIFTVAGSALDSEVWGNLDEIRNSFGRPNVVSSLRIRVDPSAMSDLTTTIERSRIGLTIQSDMAYNQSLASKPKAFISAFGILLGLLSVVVAVMASSTVFSSAIDHRQGEILLLRRIGYGLWSVSLAIVGEAVLVGLIGSVLGVTAAQLVSLYRVTIMSVSTWSNLVVSFNVTASIVVLSLIVGMLIAVLASVIPAFRMARIQRAA